MCVPHPCTHPKPRTGSHTWGSPSHLLPGPARRAPQGRHHPGLCSVTPMPGPPPAGSPHTQGSEVWGRAEGGPQGLAHRRSSSTQFKRQWLMRHRWHEGACNQLIIFPQRLLRGGGGGAGGALHSSSDSRAGSLTPDDLSNLPGARVAVRMVPVRGARDPWRAAVPPHPPPIPQTLAPPLPVHCSAAPLDSSSRPPRSCKDRGWAGRRSPLVAVGLRHRTSPGVNPHGMAHSPPCTLKGGSTAGWEHLTHAPGVSGRPDPL